LSNKYKFIPFVVQIVEYSTPLCCVRSHICTFSCTCTSYNLSCISSDLGIKEKRDTEKNEQIPAELTVGEHSRSAVELTADTEKNEPISAELTVGEHSRSAVELIAAESSSITTTESTSGNRTELYIIMWTGKI